MQNCGAIQWYLRKSGGVWVVRAPLVLGSLMYPLPFEKFEDALKYIVTQVS